MHRRRRIGDFPFLYMARHSLHRGGKTFVVPNQFGGKETQTRNDVLPFEFPPDGFSLQMMGNMVELGWCLYQPWDDPSVQGIEDWTGEGSGGDRHRKHRNLSKDLSFVASY